MLKQNPKNCMSGTDKSDYNLNECCLLENLNLKDWKKLYVLNCEVTFFSG